MPAALYLVPVVLVSVFVLIHAEFRQTRATIYVIKPFSTLLVIASAVLSLWAPTSNWIFSIVVLIGLLFCLGGDVALMFQHHINAFRIGLVLFLLGHIAYSVVFSMFGIFSLWDVLTVLLLLICALGFYRLIRPNLGSMKLPVILYILIISIMVNRAVGLWVNPEVGRTQGVLVAVGAILFYISDVILAANRFWKPWRYHRISLAFYYAGQMLIALSASYAA